MVTQGSGQPTAHPRPVLRFGDLVIDGTARRVTVGGIELPLSRLELDLLVTLAERPGRVFSREELLRSVWQSRSEWQSSATVTEHVRRLRVKLATMPLSHVRIAAVRSIGYRFEVIDGDELVDPLAHQGLTHSSLTIDGESIVDASGAAIDLFGADDLDDVVGRSLLDLIAGRSMSTVRTRLERSEADELLPPDRVWLRRLDGRELLADISTVPIDRDDRIHHRVDLWAVPDDDPANVRKRALGIQSEVADAVLILDPAWRVQTLNSAAEVMYGWSESELVGRPLDDVMPFLGAEGFESMARQITENGHWHGDVVQPRRDGTSFPVRASATLISEDDRHVAGIVLVCRPHRSRSFDDSDGPDVGSDVADALVGDQFLAYYQPIVNLETHRVIGVEALARWHHPTQGLLFPGRFLETMERSGDVVTLGRQIMRQSTAQVADWHAQGHRLDLAVNVSAQQLIGGGLADDIAGALLAAELDPAHLIIELTETDLIADVTAAAQVLDQITATGVQMAIDDFGTGWASLTYLKRFPVSVLKIDRSFTSGLLDRPNDIAIARSIIALGAELDLVVVAEGIETVAQEAALLDLGCSIGQGFLYAKARPASAPVDRLED